MGPAGAGKGTMSDLILKEYDIPHISTGDMLRDNVRNNTELGNLAKSYMDAGNLVPDDVIIAMVEKRLQEDDCQKGYLLDGFPRTLAQAEALEALMQEMGIKLDKVISLNVPDELIVGRVTGRKVCPVCGASFHVEFNPPKVEGKCDYCGADLITRKDDNAETVTKRLAEYHSQTAPLFDFYKSRNLLVDIDGTKEVKAITEEIFSILD